MAINNYPDMIDFLQQRVDKSSSFDQTIKQLMELIPINE
jgi:flagellar biosynthesis/type III secretory pathway ATPase